MTRKQWINNMTDEEATKIHLTFKRLDPKLDSVSVAPNLQGKHKINFVDHCQTKRTAVRNFLRRNRLSQKDLNVQYGRLAAGLALNLKVKAA